MLHKIPVSIWLLVFSVVVFLLQISPLPGIFLMMFGAPFWPVITVNIAFLLMFVEAISGRAPKWMIVLPALYLGGYLYCSYLGRVEGQRLVDEAARQNSEVHIPFSPDHDSLVFDQRNGEEQVGRNFLRLYDIPEVFDIIDANRRSRRNASAPEYRSVRLELFKRIAATRHAVQEMIQEKSGFLDSDGYNPNKPPLCFAIRTAEQPDSILLIDVSETKEENWLISKKIQNIDVARTNGTHYKLTGVHATRLGWFPIPMAGYALNSGNPSWNLILGFLQLEHSDLPGGDALGHALGLEKTSLSLRERATANSSKGNTTAPESN
jgi:hypothetical protein